MTHLSRKSITHFEMLMGKCDTLKRVAPNDLSIINLVIPTLNN